MSVALRVIPVALAVLASLASASSSPFDGTRFVGTWVRDASVSAPVGGKIGGPGRPVEGVTLVIEDKDGIFQVKRRVSTGRGGPTELVQRFPLDGKESVNPAPAPGGRRGEVRSKARRDGARVIVEGVQKITVDIEVKTTDVYEVSEDGKTLTVTITR